MLSCNSLTLDADAGFDNRENTVQAMQEKLPDNPIKWQGSFNVFPQQGGVGPSGLEWSC